MQQTIEQPSVTFAVDDVLPATTPFPECRMHEAALLGKVESCCDYHSMVLKEVYYHPVLAAVHTAFRQHRALVLTPDGIWLTIAQGVAHHMTIHGERLRSRLVEHQGKLDLVFQCQDWVEGSPENPWTEAFAAWTGQIRDHVGPRLHDTLVCDFSTSGPVERAASQIVMMDVFERYFHYVAYCICGIPTITLEGTPADWQRLEDKAAGLSVFDLDWWLEHLLPICRQFVRASEGDVDQKHWQSICKLREAYGGDIINGWIAKLFPYVRAFIGGPCNQRNPIFETGEGFSTLYTPSGLSRVPFTWRNLATGHERLMEAISGLVGVTQDPQTLALRPKVGWAVRAADKLDVLLDRLVAEHTAFPGLSAGKPNVPPRDMATFYHRTDGAELFGRGDSAAYRIVSAESVEPLDWGELPEKHGMNTRGPDGRIWYRFAWLADGSWLAINLDPNRRDPRPRDPDNYRYDDLFHAICHGNKTTQGKPGQDPVIALSFTELLERLLESGGRPYWLDAAFPGYGDAELYTRRD
jgi:hypothetical protein